MRMFWFVFLCVSCVNVSLYFGQLDIGISDFTWRRKQLASEAQCCSVFVIMAKLLLILWHYSCSDTYCCTLLHYSCSATVTAVLYCTTLVQPLLLLYSTELLLFSHCYCCTLLCYYCSATVTAVLYWTTIVQPLLLLCCTALLLFSHCYCCALLHYCCSATVTAVLYRTVLFKPIYTLYGAPQWGRVNCTWHTWPALSVTEAKKFCHRHSETRASSLV